jgi:hypothetical protein
MYFELTDAVLSDELMVGIGVPAATAPTFTLRTPFLAFLE